MGSLPPTFAAPPASTSRRIEYTPSPAMINIPSAKADDRAVIVALAEGWSLMQDATRPRRLEESFAGNTGAMP